MTFAVQLVSALGVAATLAFLTWPAVAHAIDVWATVEEFSYGFAVPPAAAFLVWRRRAALRRAVGAGAWSGLVIVVAALLLLLLGYRTGVNALAGVAVAPLLWGTSVTVWGWGAGRVLAFPMGFLELGLALYRGLLSTVGFALQHVTAVGSGGLVRLLGLPVQRDGFVLRSAEADAGHEFAFVVAEPCSGMSSLLALLALAALWTHVAQGSWLARSTVVASVLPLVLVANVLRVTSVVAVASGAGEEAALGYFHSASSLALFGVAVTGLVLVSRLAGCRIELGSAS